MAYTIPDETRTQIADHYKNSEDSIARTARMFGVDPKTVSTILRERGISTEQRGYPRTMAYMPTEAEIAEEARKLRAAHYAKRRQEV